MDNNEKTMMISYNKNEMNTDMELLEKYSTQIIEVLKLVGIEKEYYQEDIDYCKSLMYRIQGYARKIKDPTEQEQASEFLKTGLSKDGDITIEQFNDFLLNEIR